MPTTIRSYRDLRAWQAGMDLCVEVYRLVKQFPPEEKYGLGQQVRRAAVSVVSNIAEGHERRSTARRAAEVNNFLSIARGSLAELETQLLLAARLGFVSADDTAAAFKHLKGATRLTTALMTSLERARAASAG